MIDTTKSRTVNKTGIDVMTLVENQLFTFGKIVLLKKKDCIVLVSTGEQAGKKVRLPLEFPCTVDGVEYVADIPEEVVAAPADAPKKEKVAAGETKIAKCRAIFAEDGINKTKSEVILRFINEVGCTPAGANTYYLTCRKG